MELRKTLKKMYFFSKIFRSNKLRIIGLATLMWLALFFALSATMGSGKYVYKIGDKAREDIVISEDIVDDEATRKLRDRAESDVEAVYYLDPTVQVDAKKNIREFFERLYSVRNDFAGNESVLLQVYTGSEADNDYSLTGDELALLATMDQRKLEDLETTIVDLVLQTMGTGISGSEVVQKQTDTEIYLNTLDFDDATKRIMGKIAASNLKPNKFIDAEATDSVIAARRAAVESVVIEAGTLLVREGAAITAQHIRLLDLAGLLYSNSIQDRLAVSGMLVFSLMLVIVFFSYLRIFHNELLGDTKKLILTISVFMLIFLTSRVVSLMSIYLVPVVLFSMLIGIAVKPVIGIVLSLILAAAISVWNGTGVDALIVMTITSVIGGISVSRVHQRGNILIAGGYTAISAAVTIFSLGMIEGQEILESAVQSMYGAFGGLIAAVLALGFLPIIETLFHVLTPMKLLELSNPNHPLLKRLLIEAPGTYHHSILVGNLAEAAAHEIGADGLLSRVGAFYHDVGKLERPYYFKENQITAENPHDRLIPAVSASIIKRHSVHGVELGDKFKLPQEIVDIIIQHHGTTCIQYFYHKAKEEAERPDAVRCGDFAYTGPIPSTREAAIVMLADSVEAAVRSLQEPTHAHIETMVDKIINGKMSEDQLEASNLTFRDLRNIKSAFMVVLTGIFHERIEYPDLSDFDVRR